MRNELSSDLKIVSSPLFLSDNSEFHSFSPIDGVVSCFQSQISNELNCSPFVLTFSKKKFMALESRSKNELSAIITPFEANLQSRLTDNTTLSIGPIQNHLSEVQHASEEISKDDIEHLRRLMENEENKSTTKDKTKQYKRARKPSKTGNKIFACKHCEMSFERSQALGGHMSRAHPGKSCEYKKKKSKRKSREVERLKLLIAKKKYFTKLRFNYDELLKTPEGRQKAQTLIDRTAIKKIKKDLTKQEIDNYFENKILDEIKKGT